jgi:hypothetical protein
LRSCGLFKSDNLASVSQPVDVHPVAQLAPFFAVCEERKLL